MNIAMSRNANNIKQASDLFLRSPKRFRRTVRSKLKSPASDWPGHGTDGLGREYVGKETSATVGCASSTVASA